jgi:hypothetical protein
MVIELAVITSIKYWVAQQFVASLVLLHYSYLYVIAGRAEAKHAALMGNSGQRWEIGLQMGKSSHIFET